MNTQSSFSVQPSTKLANQYPLDEDESTIRMDGKSLFSKVSVPKKKKSSSKGFGIQQVESAQMDFI